MAIRGYFDLIVGAGTEDEAREAMYAAHVQGKRPMTVQPLDWMMDAELGKEQSNGKHGLLQVSQHAGRFT